MLNGDDEGGKKMCWNSQKLEADDELGGGWTTGVLGSGTGKKKLLSTED
jgi:hypothetical protein